MKAFPVIDLRNLPAPDTAEVQEYVRYYVSGLIERAQSLLGAGHCLVLLGGQVGRTRPGLSLPAAAHFVDAEERTQVVEAIEHHAVRAVALFHEHSLMLPDELIQAQEALLADADLVRPSGYNLYALPLLLGPKAVQAWICRGLPALGSDPNTLSAGGLRVRTLSASRYEERFYRRLDPWRSEDLGKLRAISTALGGQPFRRGRKELEHLLDTRLELYFDFPRAVLLELTNRCNMACPICPRRRMTRPVRDLDPELFGKVVDQLIGRDVRLWLHVAGEPLMHPQALHLARSAKRRGVSFVGMATNGLLLEGATAGEVLDAGLDRFQISIDSVDPETYRQLRGNSELDRVLENAVRFLEEKRRRGLSTPVVSINVVITKEHQLELERTVAFWRPHLSGKDFVLGIDYETWGGQEPEERRPVSGLSSPRMPCLRVWHSLVVLSDGSVTLCDGDTNGVQALGNVHERTLAAIWLSPAYRTAREKHLALEFAGLPVCQGCPEWLYEVGPVRLKNLSDPLERSGH